MQIVLHFVLGYIYNLHHKGTHVIITHFMETGNFNLL